VVTVLCPTRGNPGALLEAYMSFRHSVVSPRSRFIGVVDHDDPSMDTYVSICEDTSLRIMVVPKASSGNMNLALNYGAAAVVAAGCEDDELIGFIGDDHRFRTKDWDVMLQSAAQQTGGGLYYGDDLFQGENLPTAVFISAKIVRALGWFGLPGARHLYLDNTWKLLGDSADCLYYLPDIVVEHVHPAAGKAAWDENHVRVNSNDNYAHDRSVFEAWMADGMERDVATVRALVA
jgi:hypothetical protein